MAAAAPRRFATSVRIDRTQLRLLWAGVLWLPAYLVVFFAYILVSGVGLAGTLGVMTLSEEVGAVLLVLFMGFVTVGHAVIAAFHLFTMVWILAMLVLFVVLVARSELESTRKLAWLLVVVLAGFIGQALFLWVVVGPEVVVREDPESWQAAGV